MNKIFSYSLTWSLGQVAGSSITWIAPVTNNNTQFKIKSFLWDLKIRNELTFELLPLEQNNTQDFNIGIVASPAATQITLPIVGATGPVISNGTDFQFYRPGQYLLNSAYIVNGCNIVFANTNRDLTESMRCTVSFTIEIESL